MAMGWRVINQRPQSNLTPQGTFEDVWVITYTTDPEGITGTITVPSRLYEEEYVRNAIEAQVQVNKAIHNL